MGEPLFVTIRGNIIGLFMSAWRNLQTQAGDRVSILGMCGLSSGCITPQHSKRRQKQLLSQLLCRFKSCRAQPFGSDSKAWL
jgi:hypothetical protein